MKLGCYCAECRQAAERYNRHTREWNMRRRSLYQAARLFFSLLRRRNSLRLSLRVAVDYYIAQRELIELEVDNDSD